MMLARGGAASSKRLLSLPASTRAALLPSLATAANAPRMLQQRSTLPLAALAASATSTSRRALASMPHPSYQFSTSKSTTIPAALPPPPSSLRSFLPPSLPHSDSHPSFSFSITSNSVRGCVAPGEHQHHPQRLPARGALRGGTVREAAGHQGVGLVSRYVRA